MSKKWTEAHPRDNAIIDYKEFNKGYNAYKSSLNGGIDRTMLQNEMLDEGELKPQAFHSVAIQRRGNLDVTGLTDTTTGAAVGDFRGLSYNTYGGGWITADQFNLTILKDGMLHWEFSTHVYMNTFYSNVNAKYVSMRLLFDGAEVCTAYKVTSPIITFRMICDIPVTASPNTITVQARAPAASTTENTKCLFSLLAMQHLFIGRWR